MFERIPDQLAVVILAAGSGGRMNSRMAKPLHTVAGASMLHHVMRAARALSPNRILVVVAPGADGTRVAETARAIDADIRIVVQMRPVGTGNAALCALPELNMFEGRLLVLYADTPLIRPRTLQRLISVSKAVAVLGFETEQPFRYGRLIRDGHGNLERIVESGDATPEEAAVTLCNSGVMAIEAAGARRWLPALSNDNARGEYFLTDVVSLARSEDRPCGVVTCPEDEALGVNSRTELAVAEAAFQNRARREAMEGGATLVAPETVLFSFDTRLGRDVKIGAHVAFAPGVVVEDDVEIDAFSCLGGCVIRRGAHIGPFAQIRPGAGPEPRPGPV